MREVIGWVILTAALLTAAGVIVRWVRMVLRWATSLAANLAELPKIKQELAELRSLTAAANGKPPNEETR